MSRFDQAQHPRFYFGIRSAVKTAAIGFVAIIAPTAATTQSQGTVLLSAATLSYAESQVKEDGSAFGFYGSYGQGWKHLIELGATSTRINFVGGEQLQQSETVL